MHTRGSSPDGAGNHLLAVQRSNNTSDQEPKGRLLLDSISGSQKGWQNAAVINLKALNVFVKSQHFKTEGIHLIPDLMVQGDWLTRIDLKDAYFAVPIHDTHQKYLIFIWQQQTYQFTYAYHLASAQRQESSPSYSSR